ncbi:PqqD family peptide modification chaperone [Rhodococcus erythropolis]|nr:MULTISPECIES: PqqD family peptide modification chaperone [Rhodococcus erythropolis group]MCD2104879.1 PqqD family peptide modification chaperone [Rhodococcus qingshengii]MCZ4524993.1 PqqD family peptide modification chaperone [Rhodococcus erythropolis]
MSRGVSFSRTDGGAVLLDGRSGKYFKVNETAAVAIESVLSNQSRSEYISQIVQCVAREFDEEFEVVDRDVREVVDFIVTRRLGELH